MRFQRFRPDLPLHARTSLYFKYKIKQREENTAFKLAITIAFMWILVIARCAYQLTQ